MLGCVWLVAREEDVESGGEERGSAFMRSTVEQAASLCLMSAGLHRSWSLLPSLAFILLFLLSFFAFAQESVLSLTLLCLALSLSLCKPQPFSIKRVQGAERRITLVSGAGSTQRSAATRNHCWAKNWAVAACVCTSVRARVCMLHKSAACQQAVSDPWPPCLNRHEYDRTGNVVIGAELSLCRSSKRLQFEKQ